ncbi:hypothetical protein HYW55_05860 [Candidatus Gottesmanbacteria bacterium]|nr:hypothetical protein [Candidatus Gottesmanbacteria bacterium]
MFAKPVYAVNVCDVWTFCNNKNFASLGSIVSFFLPKLILAGAVIFFILIIVAGVGVISGAGGDDANAKEQSKMFLTYAVIGLLLIFGAYWILQILNFILGGSLGGLL